MKYKTERMYQSMGKFFSDFKAFAVKGNVIDMAVGVIIGGAFGKIVTSLVNDIIMPLIGVIIGGVNFTELSWKIGESTVMYGNFIQTIVDFLIIAFSIFLFVRMLTRVRSDVTARKNKGKKEEQAAPPPPPAKSDEVVLLEEIRDLLKTK